MEKLSARNAGWAAMLMLTPVVAALVFLLRKHDQVATGEPVLVRAVASSAAEAPLLITHGVDRQATARNQSDLPSTAPASSSISFGAHFDDSEAAATLRRWRSEARDPSRSDFVERGITNLFEEAEAPDVLDNVECRQTLCMLSFNAGVLDHSRNGGKALAGKLGDGVVVVKSSAQGIVVLIPRDTVTL
ncbi:MAG TPA: hypothetical protein VH062_15880 [Polyangiaceae bacterium]|jgi:hypothetical protein|nr:hypothetical protein [Polyangiaceae bacterium]